MKKLSIALLLVALCSVGYGSIDDQSYLEWMHLGREQIGQGNLEEARGSFQNALLFRPNDAEAQKGIRLAEEGVALIAPKSEFKSPPKTDEESYSQWMQKGRGQVVQGNLEEAKDSFQNALLFKPNDVEAQKGIHLAEERMARIALRSESKGPSKTVKNEAQEGFSIRVTLGSAPGIDEVDGLSVSDEDGERLEVLAVKRFWSKTNPNVGGVFGGGIFFSGNKGSYNDPYSGNTYETDLSTFGAIIQGGLAVRAGESVIFEVGPYLGIGSAKNEMTVTDYYGYEYYSDSGRGPYVLFGIKGGVFVTLGENIELGLEAGFESFSQTQEVEDYYYGGTYEEEYSGGGAHVAGVLAVKF